MMPVRNPTAGSGRWLIPAGCAALAAAGLLIWFVVRRPAPPPPAVDLPLILAPLLPGPPGDDPAGGLRPELREILGFVPGTGPDRRLELLRNCVAGLSAPECEALLAALAQRREPATDAGWHAEYVHLVSLILQQHPKVADRFARVLAAVAADASRDEVVRDYAMQHLRQVWDRADRRPELRDRIVGTFRHVGAADPVLGASAVLSLHLLGWESGQPAVPTGELTPLIGQALAAPAAPERLRLRMSCLRVAADRGVVGVLPAIRRIAADSSGEHALARMSVIAALGRLGEPADRALLQALATSRDLRIAGSVRHALATLR
jgi:hypothetical protein